MIAIAEDFCARGGQERKKEGWLEDSCLCIKEILGTSRSMGAMKLKVDVCEACFEDEAIKLHN